MVLCAFRPISVGTVIYGIAVIIGGIVISVGTVISGGIVFGGGSVISSGIVIVGGTVISGSAVIIGGIVIVGGTVIVGGSVRASPPRTVRQGSPARIFNVPHLSAGRIPRGSRSRRINAEKDEHPVSRAAAGLRVDESSTVYALR